ncbi:MAG: FKBP-type peptidyl-prolyl cis-trans isomerase [Bacteroidaceae bacterium]
MDKVSYALGMAIGQQLKTMGGEEIVVKDFSQAVNDVLTNTETELDSHEAQSIVTTFIKEQEEKQQAVQAEKGKTAKEEGEAFLLKNKEKENVMTLPSGLQYMVLTAGTGRKPKATDNVKCHYEGTLLDGTIFDSSYQRNEPAVFPLNGVIAGWTEGVQLMSEGAKFRFFIPFNLAYGSNGAGASIPPYAALVFDVELLEVM